MRDRIQALAVALVLMLAPTGGVGAEESTLKSAAATADGLVELLYDAVTTESGTTPDWEMVRQMFLDDAVVVLRTGPEETTVFTVEGWIADFVAFIDRAGVVETGFIERIVRTAPVTFGDIAHIWVLYEAQIPGSERDPRPGVDSFQLVRREGRWWIVSITNELPAAERPVPDVLQG